MFYADIEKMTSDNTCRQPRGPYAQAETWVETTAIKKKNGPWNPNPLKQKGI